MAITKHCNDCEADITADALTHDCPQRRARLALVQMSAETV